MLGAHGALEWGVAEVEDPAVGGNFPITPTVEGEGDAHNRFVEMLASHGANRNRRRRS